MNPILASILTMLLPILKAQIDVNLFRYIEQEIEKFAGFDIPGDLVRQNIVSDIDKQEGWAPILIATPQWLFNLAIYAAAAKLQQVK